MRLIVNFFFQIFVHPLSIFFKTMAKPKMAPQNPCQKWPCNMAPEKNGPESCLQNLPKNAIMITPFGLLSAKFYLLPI